MEAGIDLHLVKPVRPSDLICTINSVIHHAGAAYAIQG